MKAIVKAVHLLALLGRWYMNNFTLFHSFVIIWNADLFYSRWYYIRDVFSIVFIW